MIHALGYSHNAFTPHKPGRLCRGRERWIEPYPDEEDRGSLHRFVISGATFSDDSAEDALRGVQHAGLDLASTLATLYPRKPLVAFMEDGHPADIPDDAFGVELYSGHRAGGRSEALMVRWLRKVSGVRQLREVLGQEETPGALGFLVLKAGQELDDDVAQRVFQLVGMGTLDSPPARFQPAALMDVLEVAQAVILLHRDKHGVAVGVYAHDPIKAEDRLVALAEKAGALAVPFAIPPMLARWDRALFELRERWVAEKEEPFPVPLAPEDQRWTPRRGRGRDRASFKKDAKAAERAAKHAEE